MRNRMKAVISLLVCLCFGLTVSAQSQEGYVRTSGTAKKKGDAIQGVILRPHGGNEVMSGSDGHFSMLLQQRLSEGDSFKFSKIFKKGYEPIDKNILSHKFVYSSSVPIEIVLISTRQLTKTRATVESRARKNAEKRCRKQLAELKKKLDSQQMSSSDYKRQSQELEKQMQSFEVLIAAMADHYARTDYNKLDSLNAVINECIINGELEKADSLINTKGDMKKRANENIAKGQRLRAAEALIDSVADVINARKKK